MFVFIAGTLGSWEFDVNIRVTKGKQNTGPAKCLRTLRHLSCKPSHQSLLCPWNSHKGGRRELSTRLSSNHHIHTVESMSIIYTYILIYIYTHTYIKQSIYKMLVISATFFENVFEISYFALGGFYFRYGFVFMVLGMEPQTWQASTEYYHWATPPAFLLLSENYFLRIFLEKVPLFDFIH